MKKIKVMLEKDAFMPTRAYEHDGGLDLYSREDKVIFPQSSYTFDTGVHMAIEPGFGGLMVSKSGLLKNFDLLSDGLIDADYTGSIGVTLCNNGSSMVHIKRGQKISQLVLFPLVTPELEVVDSMEETERGANGFGSSGKF